MSSAFRDLFVGKYLALRAAGAWEFAERLGTTGCVVIFACTAADEIILVEQFRPAVQTRVIALPAGLAGDVAGAEKEDLAQAALREFEEETGYGANAMRYLAAGPSSSGLTSEIMTFFEAIGVRKIENRAPDAKEGITCHVVPRRDLARWLTAREGEGCLIDYKIHAALYMTRLGR